MLGHQISTRSTISPRAQKAPAPGPLSFFNLWGPPAGKFGWNIDVQHAGEAITQDWLRFLGDRLAKDAAFPERLLACKTISDVYQLYAEFWQQASQDYANEFTAIANALWEAARAPLAPYAAKN